MKPLHQECREATLTKNEEKIIQKGSAEELVDLIGVCEEPDTMHLIDDALEARYRNGEATIKHLSDAVDAEAERYGFFFTDCQKQFGDALTSSPP